MPSDVTTEFPEKGKVLSTNNLGALMDCLKSISMIAVAHYFDAKDDAHREQIVDTLNRAKSDIGIALDDLRKESGIPGDCPQGLVKCPNKDRCVPSYDECNELGG